MNGMAVTWTPSQAPIHDLARQARRALTPREQRFWNESPTRWPGQRFRRYTEISIIPAQEIGAMLSPRPSVWYAPFYHAKSNTIIVIDDRPEFPYRIYGQNRALYERHGYTVLDFSEDFSCPFPDSVWEEGMAMIDASMRQGKAA